MKDLYTGVTNHSGSIVEQRLPSRIRVARVWMNMGVRMSAFRQTPKPERWDEHKRLVIGLALDNKQDYQTRINRLIQAAENANVDAVILPACTFVHGAKIEFLGYHLPMKSMLIAGALDIARKTPREYGIAARDGGIIGEFQCTEICRLEGKHFTVMAAISSTIKRLTRFPEEEPRDLDIPPREISSPILLLDAGHHPYSDHYRRHTMRLAVDAIELRYNTPTAAVLASWQYSTSRPSPSWCVPEECGCITRLIDGDDILDIIEINLI